MNVTSRMFPSLGIVLAILSTQVQAKEANCIAIAGQNISPTDVYDSRHACGTCPGQAAHPNLCKAMNRAIVPYWAASADIVAVPHRGYWGVLYDNGAHVEAENTMGAFKKALSRGYRIIEVDASLTGPDSSGKRLPYLGHYFSMYAANGPKNKAPIDYPPDQIVQFKMRQRDQSRSFDSDSSLALFSTVLEWAKANDVLLMVDPKIPADATVNEYQRIVAYILNEARQTDALANIGIKTTDNYPDAIANMTPFLDAPYSQYEGKFVWSPIPNKSVEISQVETLSAIASWHQGANQSKQVITYEVGLYSPGHWAAQPFSIGEMHYKNLIDYIKNLTPLGKRSAMWSIDAMSDKGTFSRLYEWKFIGNSSDDVRGNPLRNLSYDWGRHVWVNTDRPQWYDNTTKNPY